MKDYLAELVRTAPTLLQGRQRAREYLQARILGALQRAGAMVPLAFHGGTALRFLYSSARYSEDLDFALERSSLSYDFRGYIRAIQADLAPEG
jgi:predicted nucleotidyltransferase component of viral defense system